MGTCMSKDKKGATAASPGPCKQQPCHQEDNVRVAATSSSSFSSSLNTGHTTMAASSSTSTDRATTCTSSEFHSVAHDSSHSSSPISTQEDRELAATDKHIVQIRLPITSPSKFTPSPASAAIAADTIVSITHPADEEPVSKHTRDPAPPIFCTNYLSRASFSRDLAAFSRDLASLSSLSSSLACSPLKRSPSVNASHDPSNLGRASSIRATLSPLRAGLYVRDSKMQHRNMVEDEYSSTARSRSLPKRFYGKEFDSDLAFHKRTLSRDTTMDPFLGGRKPPSSLRRLTSMDLSLDTNVSPRISVRREEASGEYRMYARHSAARNGHRKQEMHAGATCKDAGPRKKDRSPLRRSSTGKVADADQLYYSSGRCRDEQNLMQVNQAEAVMCDQMIGRAALVDKLVNCSSGWGDEVPQALCKPLKVVKTKPREEVEKIGSGRFSTEKELLDKGILEEPEIHHGPLYFGGQSIFDLLDMPEASKGCLSSKDKARSILEAMAELNLETSLFSEIEESEVETENDTDFLQFTFDGEFSPKKEFRAQKARNLLLKEAAMDAFARPSFHSTVSNNELGEESKPSELAALMALKLNDDDAETLKIRKVLHLLSMAESELSREQKAVLYNQLRMLLYSVKTPVAGQAEETVGRAQVLGNVKDKGLTARANSWPRTVKEPVQLEVTSTVSNISSGVLASQMMTSGGMPIDCNKTLQENLLPTDHQVIMEPGHSTKIVERLEDRPVSSMVNGVKADGSQGVMEKTLALDEIQVLCMDQKLVNVDQINEQHSSDLENFPNITEDALPLPLNASAMHQGMPQEEHPCYINQGTLETQDLCTSARDCSKLDAAREHGKIVDPSPAQTLGHDVPSNDRQVLVGDVKDVQSQLSMTKKVSNNLTMSCMVDVVVDGSHNVSEHFSFQQRCNSLPECEEIILQDEVMGTCLSSGPKHQRLSDVGSDASFEFRIRSTTSSPLSTPSTPLISTASTPRQLSRLNSALTAEEMAEIWDAFE